MKNTTKKVKLAIGCTVHRHLQIGVNAIVNARAGMQDLNDLTIREIEQMRDARKVREHHESRVIIHQFNSPIFRKRLAYLVSEE